MSPVQLWLILLLPLISATIITLFTRKSPMVSSMISVGAVVGSFLLSLGPLFHMLSDPHSLPVESYWYWINLPSLQVKMGVLIDPLSIIMLFVVTGVASLVHIYSTGYMHGDPSYSRYFASLSFFTFSMLGIVLSNNLVQTYIFWELVGLASFSLIGFWFEKPSAAEACKKAFLTTRVGDFGFMVGIVVIYFTAGSFNFNELQATVKTGGLPAGLITVSAILIFMGAVGKSAQFPLHVWLPDAMEGPTPVSALIHAATMVAAGVYLVARSFFLFAASPMAMEYVAYTGGLTAIMAATIAIAQNDIKRIIAYSTLSQLGLMMMGLGVGGYTAGMFHLTTHAFFKALLFLGAGSVIHAVHTQDIWEMGGLSKYLKITTPTFLIGALANAGVFPLAGFWSKDELLVATVESHHYFLYVIALLTSFFTALYMFRLFFVVFTGQPHKKKEAHGGHGHDAHGAGHGDPHESPPVMTVPLIILAFFSIFVGFIGAPFVEHGFASFIHFGEAHHGGFHLSIAAAGTAVAIGGIALAWAFYSAKIFSADALVAKYPAIHRLLQNKYYFDEMYFWMIKHIQGGIALVCNWIEEWVVISFIVNGSAASTRWFGGFLRLSETGRLQTYLMIFVTGIISVILLLLAIFIPGQVMALK
ncbi:MAG: NADH-quinone oxidoreductase subunit L [Candidatus Manganitrophaceae bacterium]|nr:MAG: NADH-quinone oxidoreductase subunit L [Candidatus Manganitrophaceae bacterium]